MSNTATAAVPTPIPPALLDTILARLAVLLLVGAHGHEPAARHAAAQMLAAYNAETPDELRLAANIISFSLHALEALSQAATPDMPLTRVIRLRGGAVSLNRASMKAELRLDQLQQARRDGTQAATITLEPPSPSIENALDLIADTRAVTAAATTTKQTWTQAYHQRQREKNLARQLAKQQTSTLGPV